MIWRIAFRSIARLAGSSSVPSGRGSRLKALFSASAAQGGVELQRIVSKKVRQGSQWPNPDKMSGFLSGLSV